ncbi:hypothetical protein ACFFHM_05810 [Halalkalibacter kiskunsagensis]|uniref:Core-binding (CB) domain-containing protein n=1 Tax=Halalkalibacter kiskunsagensis TaxID=1548599 RepID=A0ABV6K9S2_9BACI
MYNETQITSFEKHLVKKGYSNLVIGQYIRKVKEFLKCEDAYSVQRTDHAELTEVISKYLANTPLSSQKSQFKLLYMLIIIFLAEPDFLSAKSLEI